MKTATLIRLEPDVLARLRVQAERKGLTLAGLIRAVMTKWLNGEYQNERTIDQKLGQE